MAYSTSYRHRLNHREEGDGRCIVRVDDPVHARVSRNDDLDLEK
jgi:hypothetical protein